MVSETLRELHAFARGVPLVDVDALGFKLGAIGIEKAALRVGLVGHFSADGALSAAGEAAISAMAAG